MEVHVHFCPRNSSYLTDFRKKIDVILCVLFLYLFIFFYCCVTITVWVRPCCRFFFYCQYFICLALILLTDELGLHRMENPSHSNTCISLHIYCPPFDSCQAFDQRTGRANTVKVTFWSRNGCREKFGQVGYFKCRCVALMSFSKVTCRCPLVTQF